MYHEDMGIISHGEVGPASRKSFEAVKNAVCIEDYLRDQGVELRHGRATCPIHRGGNPGAFSVDAERQVFHCFSCGAGGDVIALCQKLEGGEPWEAMIGLAERYAVDRPEKPEKWHEWQNEKGKRRRMIRDNLAESYQRRYFRAYYTEYLRDVEPEVRPAEADRLWEGLRSLSLLSAERRINR